jgi:hypothetical protein
MPGAPAKLCTDQGQSIDPGGIGFKVLRNIPVLHPRGYEAQSRPGIFQMINPKKREYIGMSKLAPNESFLAEPL